MAGVSTAKIGSRTVHPIGIGTWTMGDDVAGDDAACIDAVRSSLSRGQNHIDTAEMYAAGRAEEIVGSALRDRDRESVFVASKLWRTSCTRERVRPAVEAMLTRLQLSRLDLLYIHADWDNLAVQETVEAMCDAVDAGLVAALGLSNFQLDHLQAAMRMSRHPFVALQNRYNVLAKSDVSPALLDFCREHHITVVAYQPVERGLVLRDPTVRRIADAHGVTPAQVAIAWLLRQEGVITIPKAVVPEHIEENLSAHGIVLNDDEVRALDAIT